MGKRLLKGGVGGVIGAAVYDILGKAVDWVLDPENNRITYKRPFDPDNPDSSIPKIYTVNNTKISDTSSPDPNTACDNYYLKQGGTSSNYKSYRVEANDSVDAPYKCILEPKKYPTSESKLNIFAIDNPVYDPEAEEEQNSIPIDTVSQQVIANAESGHAESKNLLLSVVSVLASMKFYDSLF